MAEVLVNQPTDRTARKVQAASGGAGTGGSLGALVGFVLAMWTFEMLPADLQEVEYAAQAWVGLVSAAVAGGSAAVTAFWTGRRVKERLENMMPPGTDVIVALPAHPGTPPTLIPTTGELR